MTSFETASASSRVDAGAASDPDFRQNESRPSDRSERRPASLPH